MAEESSRLLDLPPEIRNEIYRLLLPEQKLLVITSSPITLRTHSPQLVAIRDLAKLMRSSRQLLLEVAPVLYGSITLSTFFEEDTVKFLR